MHDNFREYLAAHPWHHETIETWPIQGKLRVRFALAASLPPASVTSSILAIVLDAQPRALFLWPAARSGSIAHLLIGGRAEASETPEQTVVREVAEETGWIVQPMRMIGFRHFFHLEARSPQTDRPYPDFIQPIFAARAVELQPGRVLPNDQIPAEFVPFSDAEGAADPAQRPLLHAAFATLA